MSSRIKELYAEHGFFSLIFEKMEDWEWYTDLPCFKLMIHLIIKSMKKDTTYRGEPVLRGQYRTSLSRLSHETGLSVKQTRNAIKKLESTGDIWTAKSRAKQRTIITLCNFEKYQIETLGRGKGQGKAPSKKGQRYNKETKTTSGSKTYRQDFRPEWFAEDLWIDFMKNRKEKKLSSSDRALTTICNAFKKGVDAGFDLETCVNEYISTRWTRFNHEWLKEEKKGRPLTQREEDNETRSKIAGNLNRKHSDGSSSFMGRVFQGSPSGPGGDEDPGPAVLPEPGQKASNAR